MLDLGGHFDGKAKQYWLTPEADKTSTFALALETLEQRSPTPNEDFGGWIEKARGI